jgi:nucleoside-diphosphate-sugar epimerase
MVVAVTGAAGDVGGYVVRELQEHGHEVVTVDLRRPSGVEATYREADVTALEALTAAFEGCEAVVHLAAIREANILPPAPTFHVNAQGTMNALEAAVANGARRFVLASSEAVLGFAYRTRDFLPDYFPMDEDHPLQPQDSYGASKIAAEELCRSYARSGALTTVCLRPCYCWGIGLGDEALESVLNPQDHHGSMWLYIHLKDIARAYRLAVEVEGIEHETVYVVADDIRSNVPTEELVERFYPGVPRKRPLGEYGALIDNSRAREVLGFSPTVSWRDEIDPATVPDHLPPED